jgi:lipid-A-disaccharide synthase
LGGHLVFELDSSKANSLQLPAEQGHKSSEDCLEGKNTTGKLEAKAVKFLVSAGEASGDMYAAGVVSRLSLTYPGASFYGCAGPKLQQAGVAPVIDAANLAVVGLAEVVMHLPRIYGEFRKLIRYAQAHRPDFALLTDNPDFNLRLARHLKKMNVPVFYLVAPQVWAWRQGRVKAIRELVDKLYCLFPFEERWFRERGVDATYIGHPLAHAVRTSCSRTEFFAKHGLPENRKAVVLLPGSRVGEASRHLPILMDAVRLLKGRFDMTAILATPRGFRSEHALERFREPLDGLSIKILEDETWDCIGHSDLALAASGTVTIEAAILGTPMVSFYRVMPVSWYAGRWLVKAPFLTMVNLVGGRAIVPELMQKDMTASGIAGAASSLLGDDAALMRMRSELAEVRASLTREGDPFERVANSIIATCQASSQDEQMNVVTSGGK